MEKGFEKICYKVSSVLMSTNFNDLFNLDRGLVVNDALFCQTQYENRRSLEVVIRKNRILQLMK